MIEEMLYDLEFLNHMEREDNYSLLKCFKKNANNFNIYIFTNFYENGKELEETWNELNNDIAFHFQTKIEKDIERWNIYIVIFVAEEIQASLKYSIEQNKYCARKIIIDNFKEDYETETIVRELKKKLFDIDIDFLEKKEADIKISSIRECIEERDTNLFELINAKGELDVESLVNEYLGDKNED